MSPPLRKSDDRRPMRGPCSHSDITETLLSRDFFSPFDQRTLGAARDQSKIADNMFEASGDMGAGLIAQSGAVAARIDRISGGIVT